LGLLLAAAASAFTIPTRNFSLQSSYQVSKQLLYSAQSDTVEGDSQAGEDDDGELELHPSDPAKTTSQFLTGLWHLIARGNNMVRGVSS
jgi:hypothetical protein